MPTAEQALTRLLNGIAESRQDARVLRSLGGQKANLVRRGAPAVDVADIDRRIAEERAALIIRRALRMLPPEKRAAAIGRASRDLL